jgi:hypothetical protein
VVRWWDVLDPCQRYKEVLKIPFTRVLGTKMTLLAEWGKPYQDTSEVGYGVITDQQTLERHAALSCCHVHISYMAIRFFKTAKVTHQFISGTSVVRQQDTRDIELDRQGPQARPLQETPGSIGTSVTADGGTTWRLRRGNL